MTKEEGAPKPAQEDRRGEGSAATENAEAKGSKPPSADGETGSAPADGDEVPIDLDSARDRAS